MPRVLIVSNRLPVTVEKSGDEVAVRPSSGGLATGLRGVHGRADSLWIGWPGRTEDLDERRRRGLDARLAERRLVPVHISDADVDAYYERFSNGLLWPLFHYMLGHVSPESDGWETYERVNREFATAVVREWKPGDVIWVHDYQLMALPAILRERLPDARIGFFLHIPFPASAVLRTLPCREEILRGLLGADLIGFHTSSYVRHFAASLLRILGLETSVDTVRVGARDVRIGAFPMGVDAPHWAALGADVRVRARAAEVRETSAGAILLGIDRLDYTKGIPRRLLSFERLLTDHPEWLGRLQLIQVAVPSRASVRAYKDYRKQTDALVGRIHGAFATPRWSPVQYLYRSISEREVAALYLAADALLVTPIRDGMNLVAKEFVAVHGDDDHGVLVLSEFAGAAAEMAEAVHVNPYDLRATAEAFHRALTMAQDERRTRMRSLRRRVFEHDVGRWTETFLDALSAASISQANAHASLATPEEIEQTIERARHAPHLVLLLDYDGTLVPFAQQPELAAPDAELYALLEALTARPNTSIHLISGRPRADLERWFGNWRARLHAEHGLWSRAAPGEPWRRLPVARLPHRESIAAILTDYADRTPGAHVEEKTDVLAWHWRAAEPVFAQRQANELRLHLIELLSNVGVEVVYGDCVIEVRPHGLHKGVVVPQALATAPADALVMAMGDDRTDEDLFACLPEDAITVHVGERASRASLRVANVEMARAFLRAL